MNLPIIKNCPGTLAVGYNTYSQTCLNRMYGGRKVFHVLPYDSPASNEESELLFLENTKRISISGVQEKFSVLLEKNKLRLISEGERGTYILKPAPGRGKYADQMPANEHLTMQIARQVYDIETAENALIFFKGGEQAYITKRFDVKDNGDKWAEEDFASLAGKTTFTHGENYKYDGNYSELFKIMKTLLPAYKTEAPRLLKLLFFNYLFSNGDAHLKNFSLIETPFGDFRLSPAYDLLNSKLHIDDSDFALSDGLLPKKLRQGKVKEQFYTLAVLAEISLDQVNAIFEKLISGTDKVSEMISASFLNESLKRNYLQAYQNRLKKLIGV